MDISSPIVVTTCCRPPQNREFVALVTCTPHFVASGRRWQTAGNRYMAAKGTRYMVVGQVVGAADRGTVSRDQIVIVTQTDDPHADDVIIALERKGEEAIRINTDEIPESARISMAWDNERPFQAAIDVLSSGRMMIAGAVRSVWWRRPGFFGLPAEGPGGVRVRHRGDRARAAQPVGGAGLLLDQRARAHPAGVVGRGGQLLGGHASRFPDPRTLVTTDPDQGHAPFSTVAASGWSSRSCPIPPSGPSACPGKILTSWPSPIRCQPPW